MSKTHKPQQVKGQRVPTAAMTATNTTATARADISIGSRRTAGTSQFDQSTQYETEPAPPPSLPSLKDAPVTFGHLTIGWKVGLALMAIIGVLLSGAWWLSTMSSKVDQHTDIIKEVRGKTETLTVEASATSAKLNLLEIRTGKVEDKLFDQLKATTNH